MTAKKNKSGANHNYTHARDRRPKDGICRHKGCGAKLSIHNPTKECYCHSVEDKTKNGEWHHGGIRDTLSYSNGIVW
jgi:hypothetical protein